jgi:mannobiose 2-epimerase
MAAEATLSSLPTMAALRAELKRELVDRILPYWMHQAVDERSGGFAGLIHENGESERDAPKGCILNARILWTFSAAYAALGDAALLAMAIRAVRYFSLHFLDPTHGGVFWMVDATGKPADERKHVYAQAFAIYAFAEHHRATGDTASLRQAVAIFKLVEAHAHDRVFGGYEEAFSREWIALDDVRLSYEDVKAPKSMNTHLHLLEAYTTLFRVWPDALLRTRLTELVELFLDTIVGERGGGAHAQQFFLKDWVPVERIVSIGHDIETSALVLAAADALGDAARRRRARDMALRLATSVLATGYDVEHGGLFMGRDASNALDTDKEWWQQAEAIVGFVNAYSESGNEAYLDAANGTWSFTRRFLRDLDGGEWHRRVNREGRTVVGFEKVGPWKCPYHNARACLEIMARVDRRAPA